MKRRHVGAWHTKEKLTGTTTMATPADVANDVNDLASKHAAKAEATSRTPTRMRAGHAVPPTNVTPAIYPTLGGQMIQGRMGKNVKKNAIALHRLDNARRNVTGRSTHHVTATHTANGDVDLAKTMAAGGHLADATLQEVCRQQPGATRHSIALLRKT